MPKKRVVIERTVVIPRETKVHLYRFIMVLQRAFVMNEVPSFLMIMMMMLMKMIMLMMTRMII